MKGITLNMFFAILETIRQNIVDLSCPDTYSKEKREELIKYIDNNLQAIHVLNNEEEKK